MVSILEPLRLVHRTHSSTKQHSKVVPSSRVLGQARILLGPAVHGMGAPKGIQSLIHNNACIQSNENIAECSLCVQIFVAECSSVATV